MSKYIAFDVETPNSRNNRISSIGIAVIENGSIIKEYSTLVNPETYFNRFNIELTGISPKAVENSPTFPQLWKTIEGMMNSGVLVAHNA